MAKPSAAPGTTELSSAISAVWESRVSFGYHVLAGLLAGLIYSFFAPLEYKATAWLEALPQATDLVETTGSGQRGGVTESDLKTLEAKLLRPSLYHQVLEREDVQGLAELKRYLSDVEKSSSAELAASKRAERLAGRVSARLKRQTRLITVEVRFGDPETALVLANAIGEEFINGATESRRQVFARLRDELARESAQTHERSSATVSTLDNMVVSGLEDLLGQVDALEKDLAGLAERYEASHPTRVQAQKQFETLTRQLTEKVDKAREAVGLPPEKDAPATSTQLKARIEAISERRDAMYAENSMEDELYRAMVRRMKEAEILAKSAEAPVRIAEPATISPGPVSPGRLSLVAAGAALGLVLGVLRTWFRAAFPELITKPGKRRPKP